MIPDINFLVEKAYKNLEGDNFYKKKCIRIKMKIYDFYD
jgi:hypothetical protein